MEMDLVKHLERQQEWSLKTFGTGPRSLGIIEHIREELDELLEDTEELLEWVDIIILAADGAMREGYSPQQVADTILMKQDINEKRDWPDHKEFSPDEPINHIRD